MPIGGSLESLRNFEKTVKNGNRLFKVGVRSYFQAPIFEIRFNFQSWLSKLSRNRSNFEYCRKDFTDWLQLWLVDWFASNEMCLTYFSSFFSIFLFCSDFFPITKWSISYEERKLKNYNRRPSCRRSYCHRSYKEKNVLIRSISIFPISSDVASEVPLYWNCSEGWS